MYCPRRPVKSAIPATASRPQGARGPEAAGVRRVDVPGNNEGACGVTEEAQTMIANDWIAAYKAIFRTDEP